METNNTVLSEIRARAERSLPAAPIIIFSGDKGVGKTHTAIRYAGIVAKRLGIEAAIYMNLEGGIRVAKEENVLPLRIAAKKCEDNLNLFNEWLDRIVNERTTKVLVIDSLTKLMEFCNESHTPQTNEDIKNRIAINKIFCDIFKKLVAIRNMHNMSIILIAHTDIKTIDLDLESTEKYDIQTLNLPPQCLKFVEQNVDAIFPIILKKNKASTVNEVKTSFNKGIIVEQNVDAILPIILKKNKASTVNEVKTSFNKGIKKYRGVLNESRALITSPNSRFCSKRRLPDDHNNSLKPSYPITFEKTLQVALQDLCTTYYGA